MSNIKIDAGLSGRYRLQVIKNGAVLRDSGWFKNLITNQGMDYVATRTDYISSCQVGSGSAAPTFTDVALQSRITGVTGPAGNISINTNDRYLIIQRTFTFANGVAAGNIAEVGVGTGASGATLFSRALVLDSGGLPTAITVLPGEDLVVFYQLWIKQPTADFTAVASDRTFTIRASNVNLTDADGWGNSLMFTAYGTSIAYTGGLGGITSDPSGSTGSTATYTNTAYVAGTYSRTSRITWGTNSANFNVRSFSWAMGPTRWQAEVNPVIPKTSGQTLRLGVVISWSRDSGPA